MKKIGFIDLYLSEWHANNYPTWIREITKDFDVAYAWAEQKTSPVDGRTSEEWCRDFGVTLCATAEEVCEKSDVLLVLAPSDPQVHLRLAQKVLPFGKPTYIDKTFAPDLATAKEIFALAKAHGTPIFSTSALRYATEATKSAAALVTGGGRSVEEYIVHQAELVEVILGQGASSVTATKAANGMLFSVDYPDGRSGAMLYGDKLPFALQLTGDEGKLSYQAIKSPYFQTLMAEIVRFYETGIPPVSEASTLEVMALRQAALKAAANPGSAIRV